MRFILKGGKWLPIPPPLPNRPRAGQDGRRGGPEPTLLRAGVVDANGGQVAIELTASACWIRAAFDGPNLFPGSARPGG